MAISPRAGPGASVGRSLSGTAKAVAGAAPQAVRRTTPAFAARQVQAMTPADRPRTPTDRDCGKFPPADSGALRSSPRRSSRRLQHMLRLTRASEPGEHLQRQQLRRRFHFVPREPAAAVGAPRVPPVVFQPARRPFPWARFWAGPAAALGFRGRSHIPGCCLARSLVSSPRRSSIECASTCASWANDPQMHRNGPLDFDACLPPLASQRLDPGLGHQ
jgi:hypothetical protein